VPLTVELTASVATSWPASGKYWSLCDVRFRTHISHTWQFRFEKYKINTTFLVGAYVACLIKLDRARLQASILLSVFRFVRDRK